MKKRNISHEINNIYIHFYYANFLLSFGTAAVNDALFIFLY